MNCSDPECESCNPEKYCENHGVYFRSHCRKCYEYDEDAEIMNTNDQLLVGRELLSDVMARLQDSGEWETADKLQLALETAQPAAVEPVAWIKPKTLEALTPSGMVYVTGFDLGGCIPLFAHPPRDVAAGGVVLPNRQEKGGYGESSPWDNGWNACLDEITRLNEQNVDT